MTTPETDIVDQLRKRGQHVLPFDEFDPPWQWVPDHLCNLAADEIDRLQQLVRQLQAENIRLDADYDRLSP